jgi:hypothetical protein
VQIHPLDAYLASEIEASISDVSENAARWYGRRLDGTTSDLDLIQRMLDDRRFAVTDRMAAWHLGLAFGNLLSRTQGWPWAVCEEAGLVDPVLVTAGDVNGEEAGLLFPMTMISHRLERGDRINLRELYEATVAKMKAENQDS